MMEVLSMIDTILVGKQIASLRKAKGLTQNQLGERLNISFQAVSKWERGEALPDRSYFKRRTAHHTV